MLAIADRMDPVDEIITIRGENTFSWNWNYFANDYANSPSKLEGRVVSLLLEMHTDGGPVVQEYEMLFDAAFNETPRTAGDNALMTQTGSGFFTKRLVYAP